LQGLSGAVDEEGDGAMTVSALFGYVSENVQAWAREHNLKQTPTAHLSTMGDIVLVRTPPAPSSSKTPTSFSGLLICGTTTYHGQLQTLKGQGKLEEVVRRIRARLVPEWPRSEQFQHLKEGELRIGLPIGYVGLQWASAPKSDRLSFFPDDQVQELDDAGYGHREARLRIAVTKPSEHAVPQMAKLVDAVVGAGVEPTNFYVQVFTSLHVDGDALDLQVRKLGFDLNEMDDPPGPVLTAKREEHYEEDSVRLKVYGGDDWSIVVEGGQGFAYAPITEWVEMASDVLTASQACQNEDDDNDTT